MFFAPFLFVYVLICVAFLAGLSVHIQIELISYTFHVLGLSRRVALFVLLVSLIGSYVNIPLYTVDSGPPPAIATANNFGVIYEIPFEYATPRTTTVAKNVGGAVVLLLIAAYALLLAPAALLPSVLGTAIVAMVTHHFAFQLPGIDIALPMLVPPLVAALVALFLGWLMRVPRGIHVIAYVSGVLGTLIGADLTNLHRKKGKWYQNILASLEADLEFAGKKIHVKAVPVKDPKTIAAVSRAYQEKYRSSPYAKDMLRAEVLPGTLRLEPA